MNDTKYSPAAAETEELMDGSLHSVVSYIVQLVDVYKRQPPHCLNPPTYFLEHIESPD